MDMRRADRDYSQKEVVVVALGQLIERSVHMRETVVVNMGNQH